jgi:hypothetical protein
VLRTSKKMAQASSALMALLPSASSKRTLPGTKLSRGGSTFLRMEKE